MTKLCECGCGTAIPEFDARGRRRRMVNGHGNLGRSKKPDGEIAKRTGHARARKQVDFSKCSLAEIGGCRGALQAHHRNKQPTDNRKGNVVVLCVSHHRLVDNGRIDLENPRMPDFYVDGSGKRRYAR